MAFNKGMVAAFETVLGRKIVVPPYPHITGAIGAATARLPPAPGEEQLPRLRGRSPTGKYRVSLLRVQALREPLRREHLPDGRTGPKYFYNDRCEKYSAAHKKDLGEDLPDLFAEREQMLMEGTEAGSARRRSPPSASRAG